MTMSANSIYSDEAVEEVNEYLRSKRAYVNAGGSLVNSSIVDTVSRVLFSMTGKAE